MNFTYDWNQGGWTTLPLGVKLSRLTRFGDTPVQFSGAFEYNFQDDYVGAQWTINLTAKFLFPL